jgi:hypothetical protein
MITQVIFSLQSNNCSDMIFLSIGRHLNTKEHAMNRGHVTGHKKERKGATDWYRDIEQANLERIEREWQAREAAKAQAGQK